MNEENRHTDPFTVPEGYFSSLEDRIRERLASPPSRGNMFLMRIKPAFMLALMFGIIAGFGYIVSKITDLIYTDPLESSDPITAMIEEGWLESSFIYAYGDEIDAGEALGNSLESTVTMDEELAKDIEASLTEEDIIRYLDLK
ncbi:MAG TPA: hypothetical protein IAC03_00420 [Candidatus Coprenecus pullistercoris]|nr:hypothetical protein [Candidatus Coprenecus pullistercoris]